MRRVNLSDRWFAEIAQGRKRIEGRKASPQWIDTRPNELWELCNSNGETVLATVTAVRRYPTVRTMLEQEGLRHVLPGVGSIAEGVAVYQQWSTPKELKLYDFLAIELQL